MKLFRTIAILLVAAALASCAPTKYVSQSDFVSIDDVAIVTPFAYVTAVEGKEGEQYSDSLSFVCSQLLAESLASSALPAGEVIDVVFGADEVYQSAMASLRDVDVRKAGEALVPEPLISLLKDNGKRYGVFTFSNGFMMDNKNYAKIVAVDALATILSIVLGGVGLYSTPMKNYFTVWTAVVDSESERIVFFNTGIADGGNPTKPQHVQKTVDHLFKDFSK